MSLSSISNSDGTRTNTVDFCYYSSTRKKMYWQHGTQEEILDKANAFAARRMTENDVKSVAMQHNAERQHYLVIYLT